MRVHEISLAGAIKVKDGPLVHIMITGWPKVVNIRSEGLQNVKCIHLNCKKLENYKVELFSPASSTDVPGPDFDPGGQL